MAAAAAAAGNCAGRYDAGLAMHVPDDSTASPVPELMVENVEAPCAPVAFVKTDTLGESSAAAETRAAWGGSQGSRAWDSSRLGVVGVPFRSGESQGSCVGGICVYRSWSACRGGPCVGCRASALSCGM